jgi:hypothetical protein
VGRISRRRLPVATAGFVAVLLLATPLTVTAHVNRVVGPYTFFVVLIEEPFFATNRAGFEFWVHEGSRPVQGLDHTLKAQAINSTRQVDLAVSPINDRGFYDVEFDLFAKPFNPGSGGNWTLRLFGTVEGLSVDEPFATTFPAYPRVAAASPVAAAAQAPSAVDDGLPIAVAFAPVVGLGMACLAFWQRRRRTPRHPIALARPIE